MARILGRHKVRSLDIGIVPAADWSLNAADFFNVPITVTSGRRSWVDQLRLRRKHERCVSEGRFPSAPDCRFPAALPGRSAHNFGLAWDSVAADGKNAELNEWWAVAREFAGFRVPRSDIIHAEHPNWRALVGQ